MIDDINDVRHTSTLAKFEEAVRRSSPGSDSGMAVYSELPEAIRNHLAELEMFIGDCDGQWTALQTSDANVVLDNGTIDASGAVKAFNGIVAALHSSDHAQTPAVTDEMVERAWAGIVGRDIADICHNASVVRGDIRAALVAALADTSTDRETDHIDWDILAEERLGQRPRSENGRHIPQTSPAPGCDSGSLSDTSPVRPCPGCDGHECDSGCAYPGAVSRPLHHPETSK